MKRVTISDYLDDQLSFDLIDLLDLIGSKVYASKWKISDVEAVGESADSLRAASDTSSIITGSSLITLAKDITQIIEGDFVGFLEEEAFPWIRIRAIDSSEYDVETDDEEILDRIRSHFRLTE